MTFFMYYPVQQYFPRLVPVYFSLYKLTTLISDPIVASQEQSIWFGLEILGYITQLFFAFVLVMST